MNFALDFFGLPVATRANVIIPLLIGPPGDAAVIADGTIANAKLANVATATFKGRTTSGSGAPEDLTATQATALLNLATSSLKGLMAPADFSKLAGITGTNTGDQTTITGNAGTATTLQTGRTISITGDATWTSGTFNGSANVTGALTLATVNSNVGTFGSTSAVPVITVNNKGIVTAVSTAALGTAATVNTGTSGGAVPLLNGTNTWSATQTFSANSAQTIFGFSGGNNYIDGTLYVRGTVNGSTVAQFLSTGVNLYQPLVGTSATFSGNISANGFFGDGAGITGTAFAGAFATTTGFNGYVTLYQGNGTSNTGYVGFFNSAGASQGFIGYAATNGPIAYQSNTGGGHLFTGGPLNVSRASGNTDVALFENTSTGSALNGIVSKIQSGGNNTSSFHFAGVTNGVNLWYLYGNGTTSYSSDERIKNRFEPARDGYLEDWKKLKFERWNYRKDAKGTPKNLGPTAQNVQKVFPSLALEAMHEVDIDDVKIKPLQVLGSVLYGEVLGKVVQELAFAVEDLQSEMADLRLKVGNNS